MPPAVISIANNKGGSGKTTSAYYLARSLAAENQHVILIDSDGQASLTKMFGLHSIAEGDDDLRQPTLGHVLRGEAHISQAVVHVDNCHIVPCQRKTESADAPLDDAADELVINPMRLFRLKSVVRDLNAANIVIIDTPPNLGSLVTGALLASDYWIAAAKPDAGSVDGIAGTMAKTAEIERESLGSPRFLGAIVTQASEHINSHQAQISRLRSAYRCLGVIPRREGADADQVLRFHYSSIARDILDYILPREAVR